MNEANALVDLFLSQASAVHAKDLFYCEVLMPTFVLLVIVALFLCWKGCDRRAEQEWTGQYDGWFVASGFTMVVAILVAIAVCAFYAEMLQIEKAPGVWAAKKAAEAIQAGLNVL